MRRCPVVLSLLLAACSEYDLGVPKDGKGPVDGTGTTGPTPTTSDTTDTDDGATCTDTVTDGDADADADADTDTDTGGYEDACEDAGSRTAGYLDAYQTAGDGKVVFCHQVGGPNWVEIDTDISACLPHLDHELDVFPTTGCDS